MYIQVLGFKYLSTNPLGSKTWTSLSLSCLYVGRRIRDGEYELWWSRSFAWSDWDTYGSPYACSWRSISHVVLWYLHFSVSFFIHSLLMLTWNMKLLLCSLDLVAYIIIAPILYLTFCAAWFVRRLWSAPVRLYLLLMQLDLFAACGVHQLYYTCFLCGLIYSPLYVTMFWLRPMFVPSWYSSSV
jgi:hypothetical protein